MSDYDRFANARSGAGVARSGAGAIDQGLRAYMLGVYNYMALGLGLTGLVAFSAYKAAVVETRRAESSTSPASASCCSHFAAALGRDLRAACSSCSPSPPAATRCR